MKRLSKILLVFLMVLGLTACSGGSKENEPAKIEMGKENKFDDLVSYKIETISRPQQITPDVIGSFYTYYKPSKSTNVLIDVTMYMTNLQKKEMKLSSMLKWTFVIDKTDYVASTAMVSEDGKTISQGGSLAAEGTNKVHFYAEVKPSLLKNNIEFKLTTVDEENPKEANMSFKLTDIAKNYESKNLNDTIVLDGRGEIALQAVNITKKLEPANPVGLYTYYQVQNDGNSFVVLTTSIKNISESDITASNIAVAKLVDKDSNEYPANSFYEKDDRSNLASASTTVLTPGQSGMIHFVFEVSDAVANGEKSVRITYNGKVFIVNL